MANQTNNPSPIVDGVLFFITSGESTRQLVTIEDHNTTYEGSVSSVVGVSGPIGHTTVGGFYTISLTVRRSATVPNEVDWRLFQSSNTFFRFSIQEIGGSREIYDRCRVSTVGSSSSSDGNVQHTVSILAQDFNVINVQS